MIKCDLTDAEYHGPFSMNLGSLAGFQGDRLLINHASINIQAEIIYFLAEISLIDDQADFMANNYWS